MALRAIVACLVLCLAASPSLAQGQKTPAHTEKKETTQHKTEAPSGDPVVARVNGVAVHRSDLDSLRATLPPQAQQQPPNQLYSRLIEQLVALQLVVQAAHKEKLTDDPRVKKMQALATEQILQDAYFDGIMRKEITEAKLKARYEQKIKDMKPHEEVRARHILVPTEKEAKAIIDELKKGADFAKLAAEKTTDPAGKAAGGDLGYFSEQDMVPAFAKAAFALKPGQFSKTPVKTQFGWHVIKVEDRRTSKPPTYQEVAPQLARQMAQEIYAARVKQLAAAAKIEVFNPDGSKPTPLPAAAAAPLPPAAAAPAPLPMTQPALLPLQNGTPGAPPPSAGPPTLAPATQGLGK
jgi:peptidyl-prolyl cis-trans isomerase C